MSDSSYLTNFISGCFKQSKDLKEETEKQIQIFTQELKDLDDKRQDRLDKLVSLNSIAQSFVKAGQLEKIKNYQIDPRAKFNDLPSSVKEICRKIISIFENDVDFKSARQIMNLVANLELQATVYSSLSWLESIKILSRNQEKGYWRGKMWESKESILSGEI